MKKHKSEVIENSSELSGFTPEQLMFALSHLGLMKVFSGDARGITAEVVESEETQRIILPKGMGLLEASKELKNMHTNLEQEISVDCKFEGHDWQDVLYAVKNVSEQNFGWINGVVERHWWGTERPAEIDIVIDVKNNQPVTEKCFYGKFQVAAWDDAEVNVSVSRSGEVNINVVAKKKFSKIISGYFQDIRTFIANNSIFRGKTVVVTAKSGAFNTGIHFQITENKSSDPIILNEAEQIQLDNFIIGDLKVPGKKSYLFTGPYGNGKTETAMSVGREANKEGIPFFYIKDSSLFDRVLVLAIKYQPCIIFLEDLDEVASGNERDERINRIINTVDGTETKGSDITVIFTTNHEDRINPALRRPGRIDLVLEFGNPNKETKLAILKKYLQNIKGSDKIAYDELINLVGDVSGSVVAQMGKRAVKLANRNGHIDDTAVKAAILSMGPQIRLMNGTANVPSKAEQFSDNFADLVLGKVMSGITDIKEILVNQD